MARKKKLNKIPKFKNEDEEFEFWSTHDTTDYVDWSKAQFVTFPNLKLTPKSKIKMWLAERVKKEMGVVRAVA